MFKLIKIENGRQNVPEPEYLEAKASEEIVIGEALVLSAGVLTKCAATTAPQYIAMASVGTSDTKRTIAACRVESNQLYDVPFSVAPGNIKVGDKVTLATDGIKVTATTDSGVAKIVSLNGAAIAGDVVTVRF